MKIHHLLVLTGLWLSSCHAMMEIMLVYGYDGSTLGRYRVNGDPITWKINPKPKLGHNEAKDTRYACQSRAFMRPDFDSPKPCEPYQAKLCGTWVQGWDDIQGMRDARANFGWISPFSLDRAFIKSGGRKKPPGANTHHIYDYTIEFFSDENCETRMLDPSERPVAFTVDDIWDIKNRIKAGEYLQESQLPITGFFRATKMGKAGVVDDHHETGPDSEEADSTHIDREDAR